MSAEDRFRLVASIRERLRNVAQEIQEDFESVLIRYAIERFLYRLTMSPQRSSYVLKGATLYAMWEDAPRRGTRDMDLLVRGDSSAARLSSDIEAICNAPVEDDGLNFDLSVMTVQPIRETTEYGGTRVRFRANLGNIRIPFQIDIGVGDVVTPSPTWNEFPTFLKMPRPRILTYPVETVIAEKLNAVVMHGLVNSRLKDYYDLLHFAKTEPATTQSIAEAVFRTFLMREQTIPHDVPPGLSDAFAEYPGKSEMWNRFQVGSDRVLELKEALQIIREFAMPIFFEASQRSKDVQSQSE